MINRGTYCSWPLGNVIRFRTLTRQIFMQSKFYLNSLDGLDCFDGLALPAQGMTGLTSLDGLDSLDAVHCLSELGPVQGCCVRTSLALARDPPVRFLFFLDTHYLYVTYVKPLLGHDKSGPPQGFQASPDHEPQARIPALWSAAEPVGKTVQNPYIEPVPAPTDQSITVSNRPCGP